VKDATEEEEEEESGSERAGNGRADGLADDGEEYHP
jgi:hypothetical protein